MESSLIGDGTSFSSLSVSSFQSVIRWLEEKDLLLITASFVSFHTFYWVCRFLFPYISTTYGRLESNQKGYWCSSVVSSVHSTILTLLAIHVLQSDPGILKSDDIFYRSEVSRRVIGVFVGYLTSDFCLALYFRSRWSGWLANLVHHVSLLSVWTQFYYQDFGHYFASVSHFCEITTPFVNQRWFFYESNMKFHKIYHYNGMTLTALWFLTRIVLYTYLGYKMVIKYDQWLSLGYLRFTLIWSCYFIGFALQYFWFYKILKGAIKTLTSSATRKKNSATLAPKGDTKKKQ